MESKRQHKFSRQLLKDVNEVFQKDPRHFFGSSFVTITEVEVAVDLSLAKIFFSVFPASDGEKVLESLNTKKSEVRKNLGNLIGKRIRKIPELAFFHDTTQEHASHMDRIINSLVIPPAPDEEEE
ncbi:MAG: 30S ribosome-binding factor RbfA [Cyclobacteriaceae bacterium]|nr:30S ribosome-binding factor RbfA [Cyclobacteriaceae bacterium]